MKKSLFILAAAIVAMAFSSCDPVNPNPDPKDENNFKIEVSDITTTTALVSVTPKDLTNWYYFDIEYSSTVEEYGGVANYADTLLTYLYEDYVEYGEEYAEDYGITSLSAYVRAISSVGADSYEFEGLWGETKFTVIAFMIDSLSLSISGKPEAFEFTTATVTPSSNTFKISVDGGFITVTPSNFDPYFFDYVEKDVLTTYEYTIEEYALEDVQYMASIGYLDYFISTGADSYDYSEYMEDGVTYVAFAVGVDGGLTTKVESTEFVYTAGGAAVAAPKRMPARAFKAAQKFGHKSIR